MEYYMEVSYISFARTEYRQQHKTWPLEHPSHVLTNHDCISHDSHKSPHSTGTPEGKREGSR